MTSIQNRPVVVSEENVDEKIPRLGQWYWVGPSFPQDASQYRGVHRWMPDEFYGRDPQERDSRYGPEVEVDPRALEGNGAFINDGYEGPWLGCVVAVGSNHVTVEGVFRGRHRVHFRNIESRLTPEPDAQKILRGNASECEARLESLVNEARALASSTSAPSDSALALVADDSSPEDARARLVASQERLPALYKKISSAAEEWRSWLTGSMMQITASIVPQQEAAKAIAAKIFHIGLYAGVEENLRTVRGGDPAPEDAPICVHQRRLYMDEECVARYRAGGIRLSSIHEFDDWLLDHVEQMLPHPRSVVAFRVRRHPHPEMTSFVDLWRDTRTYLYLRNGEQIYRLSTEVEFDETLFPDDAAQVYSEEHLVDSWGRDVITRREWEDKGKNKDWHPWTHENPYYDDIERKMIEKATEFNRIALILQGILDRSTVFHPHPPVKLWTQEGFAKMIRLLFDATHALPPPNRPSFEAYRERWNSEIKEGSVIIGQREAWRRRLERDYGHSRSRWPAFVHHDPGPPSVMRVDDVRPRKRTVVLRWQRPKIRGTGNTTVRMEVSYDEILNVSSYKPGDFRRFYDDPRTREDYMTWAPLLLLAEDVSELTGQPCTGLIDSHVSHPGGRRMVKCHCGIVLRPEYRKIAVNENGKNIGLWKRDSDVVETPPMWVNDPIRQPCDEDDDEDEDVEPSQRRIMWAVCTPPHPRWGIV